MDDIFEGMIIDKGRLIPIDEVFDNINKLRDYILSLKLQKDKALKQLKEYNKDVEIQKLQTELNELKNKENKNMCFVVTPEEQEMINDWIDKHIKDAHNGNRYAGAIGGMFTYRFVPTSIGDIGEIICSCGEKFCFRELE